MASMMMKWVDMVNFDILFSVAGVVVGGLITALVSRYYYKRAADDLKLETSNLRKLVSLVLSFLENEGVEMTVRRDDQGEVVGLVASIRGSATGTSFVRANIGGGSEPPVMK